MKKKPNENITHLNNDSTHKTLDSIRQQKRKRFVRMRTGIILVTGLVLVGIAGFPLMDNSRKTDEFNQLHVEAAGKLEELETEKEQLEYQVELLEDEEYVAKLARDELNLSRPNEILINLPEEEEIPSDEEQAQKDNTEENESE